MTLILTAALLAAVPAAAPAPEPARPAVATWGPKSATATAEKTQVHLGEPFTVTVEVRHAKGELWALKPAPKLDPFALRSVTSAVQPGGEDLELTRLQLEVALFQLGPHALPDLQLVATMPKAKPQPPPREFSLPGPQVTGIATAKADPKKRDIRGPVPFKVTSFRALLYLAAVLAVLGSALWGLRWWRQRPRRESIVSVPVVPEDQTALTGLTTLEGEGLPARGRFKEFHLVLSEILRRYLSDRYEILGLDMTSEELYQALARLPTEGLSLNDLAWVCSQGDLAKFAKAAPTVEDCRQALQLVRQLVVRTRRAPLVAPAPRATERAA